MLTLDEAIQHCEEKEQELMKEIQLSASIPLSGSLNVPRYCECANNHHQLAEWLKELRSYREKYGSLSN